MSMKLGSYSRILMPENRWFLRLSLALILLALLTMLLGPLVRAEDAGLACPDWPLCKGQLFPRMDYQIFLEWLHRIVAGLLSILLLIWASLSFFSASLRKNHGGAVLLALVLLGLQIALGAWTITQSLDAYVVSSHLLNAILFLSVLVYCWHRALRLYAVSQKKLALQLGRQRPGLALWGTGLLLILIFLQLFLGARVSTNEAGRACNAFPACYEEAVIDARGTLEFVPQYFPPMEGNTEKHMTHRFMAYALFIGLLGLVYFAVRQQWPSRILRLLWLVLFLFTAQILLGGLNVILSLPVTLTVAHSFLAYGIYLTALLLFLEARFASSHPS